MGNVEIYAPLVNGSVFPYYENGESCKYLVERILGDDLRPPARSLTIRIITTSGKEVVIVIPNDHSEATVRLDGEKI
ncbi:hypothetical protein [Nitrosomonas ureae]|uniref:Uncharacterized protein n=1 Tax=Nitrosomonas ureae TaxID=44577 RepID=A0A1H2EPX9_9PROT|nr:hypothetical protein [Nitrosomonas ureae]ALQ51881.1 hypothetical protein ATY38_12035 [Nitrosomonas ureae]SDT97155.1 hypothetical protein SAMN05216406_11464 [Nitrosomonas ureae]